MAPKAGEKLAARLLRQAIAACKSDTKAKLIRVIKVALARNIKLDYNLMLPATAISGSADCMKYLLKLGADVNIKRTLAVIDLKDIRHNGVTPLDAACIYGRGMCVELLLKAGAKMNMGSKYLITPLVHAAGYETPVYGRCNAIKHLLKHGADVNASLADGCTPLVMAIMCSAYDVVKTLLKGGADPNKIAPRDGSPLMVAVEEWPHKGRAIFDILLAYGADVTEMDHGALRVAIATGNAAAAAALLARYGTTKVPDDLARLMAKDDRFKSVHKK